jgi:beta-lactamase regulating signal transducer with metallopeptidase domain
MTSQGLLLYTLKLCLLSGVFIGYYWLALRNKRFHYFNRFYLLASLLLSLIIPILRFDWFANEKPVFMGSGETIDLIVGSTYPESNNIGIGNICILLMIITSALMITLSGYHIYKVYRIKRQSQITPMKGFDLMYTDEESAPFSFLDNLFWKRSISIEDEGGKQIFKHELTHIQQKHTWDRLLTQLCCSIFWINPFYWIIQKELETIHEFIADEAAVGNQDVESFAKMLIQTHYGNHFFETKHSFFYSSIKRRLTMLTTTTNTRFSYLRRVMLLPLLLTSISIFSVRVHAKEKIETKIDAISNSIFHEKVDTSKPPPLPPLPPNLKDIIKNTKKLVLVDGIEANKNELKHTINPNEINRYEIEFVPAKEALKKYGSKGKYGAIAITHVNHFGKNNEPVNSDAQIPAKFPGGLTAWVKYLEGNVNRDIPVNKGAPPGNYTVLLSFIVDKNGGVSDVKAENDPGYGTAEEAKRVIIKGPNWIPAKLNGLNVIYRHKQSITFVVSEEKRVV